jgi:hypothetical protein
MRPRIPTAVIKADQPTRALGRPSGKVVDFGYRAVDEMTLKAKA